MTTYTVASPKGGTTKTTAVAEIVSILAARGRRVLAIDLDEQGSLTTRMGIQPATPVAHAAIDVLLGHVAGAEAAVPAPSVEGAAVLVGTHELHQLDGRGETITALRDELPYLRETFDDVVVDTPASLGHATLAGLAAADVLIAPCTTQFEGLDQLGRLTTAVAERIAPRINRGLELDWIMPTRFQGHRNLDRGALAQLQDSYHERVTTTVREAVVVGESYLAGMPVGRYAPHALVVADLATALEPVLTSSN